MAAFSGFYESHKPPPSGNTRSIELPRPGGHRGDDTERVITQWWCLVASGEALVMLRCIRQYALYCIGTPPWPSKLPATDVHSFALAAYFDCCNRI
jgi:hypothetical protein